MLSKSLESDQDHSLNRSLPFSPGNFPPKRFPEFDSETPTASPQQYFPPYQPPRLLHNGLVMTGVIDTWHSITWRKWGQNVSWLSHLPHLDWKTQIFQGAEDVPLWSVWCCPAQAKGTLIVNTGLTGQVQSAWYAHLFAHKAYQHGYAVLLYDWRGHGRTAELSPVPASDGWREGSDQVRLAEQLVAQGCPQPIILVGFSFGGQLALWGLKAAAEADCSLICGAATLSCHLESALSLAHLRSSAIGRWIEQKFVQNFLVEVRKTQHLFPNVLDPQICDRIHNIEDFDREIPVPYYGFNSVEDYYQKTSCLYFLEQLQHPYLILYAQNDPLFDPALVEAAKHRIRQNPQAHLLLTPTGGHIAHISQPTPSEDQYWGFNRILDFCDRLIEHSATSSGGSSAPPP